LSKENTDKMVPIGRFSTPHGVKGEIKFKPYEGIDDFIWDEIFVIINKGLKALVVEGVRGHTGYFLLTIKGLTLREEAAHFTGLEVSIPESELPTAPEGEYYYKDLVGLAVRTDDGRDLGNISRVFSAGGGNDVFEIQGPLGEVLVPVIEETIKEVNIKEKLIIVHLLEGLLNEE